VRLSAQKEYGNKSHSAKGLSCVSVRGKEGFRGKKAKTVEKSNTLLYNYHRLIYGFSEQECVTAEKRKTGCQKTVPPYAHGGDVIDEYGQ